MRNKILKKLLVVTMASALMVGITGCGSAEKTNNEEKTTVSGGESNDAASNGEVASDGEVTGTVDIDKFVVGFDASFPPYGYLDENNEYVGFDLDLAAEVCKRNDWELVKQPIDWDSKDMELNSGTITCIWNGFTMSEDRLDKYAWSEAYVDNSQVIVVRKDSGVAKLDDLAGKTVAVQAASSALEALESDDCKDLTASFASLEQVPDYNQAFMYLESGAADAIAMDIGVAEYQIANKGDDYVILEEAIMTEQYGVGFKLGNEALRDQVQTTLYDMVKDGTFATIAEKWELSDAVCLEAK